MDPDRLTTAVWEVQETAFPADGSAGDQTRFLLRYAVLAPSSHNSQPWSFAVDGHEVAVHVDPSRWLEVADPDKRELFISLGCAVENLCIAAERFGFTPQVTYPEDEATPTGRVRLDPETDPPDPRPAVTFEQITDRRTAHQPFADRTVPEAVVRRLEDSISDTSVTLETIDDAALKRTIAERQAQADEQLMADPAYRRELGGWIGRGALGDAWPMARIGQLAVTHLDLGNREGRKNARLLESAPIVAVFSTPTDDPEARIRVGQAFERLALVAQHDGLAIHPMSQILEWPASKRALASDLGLASAVPQHLVRIGYPTVAEDHTPRWPLEAVLRDRTGE